MPSQQDLFPPEDPKSDNLSAAKDARSADPPAPLWLQRVSIVILVVFCLYVGILLCVLPWSRYWQENSYMLTSPSLGPLLNSGITRGIVSGVGLLDVWIGISEIIHYREYRA